MAENSGQPDCSHWQAQVARLRAENDQLRRENERLRKQIERLRRALQRAQQACRYYLQKANETLSQRSGVPRGNWAYARGGHTVAAGLWSVLNSGDDGG